MRRPRSAEKVLKGLICRLLVCDMVFEIHNVTLIPLDMLLEGQFQIGMAGDMRMLPGGKLSHLAIECIDLGFQGLHFINTFTDRSHFQLQSLDDLDCSDDSSLTVEGTRRRQSA